jgi:hypothetical protein
MEKVDRAQDCGAIEAWKDKSLNWDWVNLINLSFQALIDAL